ncbi:MAG TPA: L,D-transpeptidase family protein, partial [Alphaproteobacteria bacterium]|nr:L,D-transpeptidase family protein [Alphaproteobacteria bacterium]
MTSPRSHRAHLLSVIAIAGLLILGSARAAGVGAGTAIPPVTPNAPPAQTPAPDWQQYSTPKADKIVVFKSQRKLELLRKGEIIRTYPIALGRNPIGPKLWRGDGKTPEGTYFIDRRNPASDYHLSMHISYPETADIKRAVAMNVDPGGNVLIHGEPNILNHEGKANLLKDWTA